jgi:putative ABC transport system permease protein
MYMFSHMIQQILNSFALALGNIRSNIFHTILSVLGIVIGVAALVSILSLIDGMERYAREQIAATTSLNAIVIKTEFYKTLNNVRIKKDSATTLSFEAFKELHGALSKKVKRYFRVPSSGTAAIVGGGPPVGVATFATDTALAPDTTLRAGSMLTSEDIKMKRQVAIVNNSFLETVKIDSSHAIGREILFRNWKLTIKGIIANGRQTTPCLFFPITLVENDELRMNPADAAFEVKHTEDIPALKDEITRWLKDRYGKGAEDFKVLTNEFRVEQVARGFQLFRIIMGLIVGISVIVGGIGVMNVLLISVTERTFEIGIRKASGANRRDIALLFLTESVAVSAFGAVLGVVFGIVFTMIAIPIVKAVTLVPFQADYTLNTIAVVTAVALLVGIIFGTYPAIRASRLNPVDAIRHE